MNKAFSILASLCITLFGADTFGQNVAGNSKETSGQEEDWKAALEFLADLPELKGVSLRMPEKAFLNILKQRKLKYERTTAKDETAYYVHVPGKERDANIYFGFRDALCSGIQRLQPGPKK